MVGRDEELSELRSLLAEARDGQPVVALVCGEAGIGKSRLLAEFAQMTRDEALVLVGRCVDLGGISLPFAPVTEVFRGLTREFPSQRIPAILGATRHELGRLVPQLSERRAVPVDDRPDPHTRAGLFSAVLDAFELLARDRPLVVAFEDLHWADRSTLDLVGYLAANLRATKVLFLATFRTDELHRRHPLGPVLAELARVRTVVRLDLSPLGAEEVAEQIAAIRGSAPAADLVDEIFHRSDGNAFYVEQLLAESTPHAADRLPSGLRDVVLS
ncbi:MAG: AAA family ATPase, partial [Actinomycetota bacterium]|nr:AAA family ATPase [Actinomycetota bacterium]